MAKHVEKITLGIDIAKAQHVVYDWHSETYFELDNQRSTIRAWLQSLHSLVQIALEPTSTYHLILVEEASALGIDIYLVNTRQLAHYREAVNLRRKTDPDDAWLLARYLHHEGPQLRPFTPQCRKAQRLWALIVRRGTLTQTRQRLQQSFAEVHFSIRALLSQLNHLRARLTQQILQLLRELGWWQDYQRCLSIPGIGPDNAAALTAAYHRGAFAGSDAFIAYLGLDVRIRESGQYRGKRKLTKRGEAELRRLLYCAARPATSYAPFAAYRQRQLDKGLSKTAANIITGRKLARIAFALMSKQQMFIKKEIATG